MKAGDSWAFAALNTTASHSPGTAPATDENLADRAEVALLTTDGADFRRVGVDAVAGVVTLRGRVGTESEKNEAAASVRKVDGVHQVNNQIEVAPDSGARPTNAQGPGYCRFCRRGGPTPTHGASFADQAGQFAGA